MVDIIDEPIKIDNPKSDEDAVKVVVVVDETGSMLSAAADTIKNLNGYLDEQASREKKVLVSVYTFNSDTGVVERFRSVNAKEAPRLSLVSTEAKEKLLYTPAGMTPLYDAIGKVIGLETDDVPTLLVIQTDGGENSSREFHHAAIVELIKKKEEDGWTFVFLMADIARETAINVSSSLMGRDYQGATMTYSKGTEDLAFRGLVSSTATWEGSARDAKLMNVKLGANVSQDFFAEGTRDIKKGDVVKKGEMKKD